MGEFWGRMGEFWGRGGEFISEIKSNHSKDGLQ
jgi:hypothetical protein